VASRPHIPAPDQPHSLDSGRPGWFSTAPESEGAAYVLTVLRSHLWLIAICIAACVGAALLYLSQAPKVYEAQADLLVTPIPRDNETLIGLGLPRESADPIRDVETIARLIETPAVARSVIQQLELDTTARKLLKDIDAAPVAQSNVITITAKAGDPELAARKANAFANASVNYRTERLRDQIDLLIPGLRRQIARLPAGDAGRIVLVGQLRELEALQVLKDPTLRLETPAEASSDQVSPRPALTIAAAVLAGLLLGGGVALGLQLIDPRLTREEQLRRYRVPILARVPIDKHGSKKMPAPLLPRTVSPATHDAYLLLGATLSIDESGPGAKRSVLVTGPTSGDGKTTSALNLATAIAEMERVVLVEADSRRPVLAKTMNLRPKLGATTVLARRVPLSDALVTDAAKAPRLQMLLQSPGEVPLSAAMTFASADWLVRQAHLLANWLVVDAPPLTLVPDALPLAKQVDHVILVVRLGNTKLKALEELAELLVQQGITPAGFVVVGGKGASYYQPNFEPAAAPPVPVVEQSTVSRREARRAR
jgi:Mrp family chromosome partitioning ATPase